MPIDEKTLAAMDASAHELPSTFTNRFFVITGPVTTRIAFAEVVADKINYHQAVTMHWDDAVRLANLILQQATVVGHPIPTLERSSIIPDPSDFIPNPHTKS